MRWLKSACIVASLLAVAHTSWAGVVVGGTRIVYDGEKKEASIRVSNGDKKRPYLIQSWVEERVGDAFQKAPFIMTPPLFRLDAEQDNTLRIIRTGETAAKDTESVFWVNIKSIPTSEQSDSNQLQISIKTRIKLFYRPAGLPGSPSDAHKTLTFQRHGSQLTVSNPSAYHVSFHRVSVGETELKNAGMVAPGSTLSWTLPASTSGPVSWQAITDFGGITAASERAL